MSAPLRPSLAPFDQSLGRRPWQQRYSISAPALPFSLSKPYILSLHFQNRAQHRRYSPSVMSSGDIVAPTLGSHRSQLIELDVESDFLKLLSADGYLSICGFGSLLSERSARSTFPDLINFRVARLNGFRRVFAHVAPIFFERGIANPETKEISSLSVEPYEDETLIVTVFEIRQSEIPSFIEREHEFRFLAVLPETLQGNLFPNPAVLCARYSDEEYFQNRCKGSRETFFQRYGRYNIHKIWRDDILPCRIYLRHCKESWTCCLQQLSGSHFPCRPENHDKEVLDLSRFRYHGGGASRTAKDSIWWLTSLLVLITSVGAKFGDPLMPIWTLQPIY